MTPAEAIEWLKAIEKKYIHGGDDGFDEKRKVAINNAVNALEKQIPKKVESFYDGDVLLCPCCGFYLMGCLTDPDHDPPYCFECGQKLSWEVDSE